MSALKKAIVKPEEYLDIERNAGFRSEYYAGEMFAMAGATESHNLVVVNVVSELRQLLRHKPCRVYPSDMRVRVSAIAYTYPDAVALCGEPRFTDERRDTLLNPSLIVEVLSSSTEAYDRGLKFEQYRHVESLREYLLLASDRAHADVYSRQADGRWLLTSHDKPEDILVLESVGTQIAVADLYEKVDFPAGLRDGLAV